MQVGAFVTIPRSRTSGVDPLLRHGCSRQARRHHTRDRAMFLGTLQPSSSAVGNTDDGRDGIGIASIDGDGAVRNNDDHKEEDNTTASASLFTDAEWKVLEDLHERASSSSSFPQTVQGALHTLSPSIITKLRSHHLTASTDGGAESDGTKSGILNDLATALEALLDSRLSQARDLLQSLLGAGEIKKLDALIGKAARSQQLDVAFFQVLQMNLQDAMATEGAERSSASQDGTLQAADMDSKTSSSAATTFSNTRYQILQHIYTRCQEEVEKTIAPGMALLNKLLRTEQPSIRQNQLRHYLCPQPTVITAPDGKQVVLSSNSNRTLVEHDDFCNAIGKAVQQIRTVQSAGGTSPEIAAHMVESCRQVAKEARMVLAMEYGGVESSQVVALEEALQPIFRPDSPNSPYMKGEISDQ